MNKNKVELTIVVSGTGIKLEANTHQTLKSLVAQALKAANEAGDPEQWGFFIEQGKEMVGLDANIKVEDALKLETTIYLNKKAGAAG